MSEGVALPTRLKFKQLPENLIPQSQAVINATADSSNGASQDSIDTIIDRWRGATMSKNGLDGADFDGLARDEFSSIPTAPLPPQAPPVTQQPTVAPRLDPDRFKILKKPLEGGAGALGGAPREPLSTRWQR